MFYWAGLKYKLQKERKGNMFSSPEKQKAALKRIAERIPFLTKDLPMGSLRVTNAYFNTVDDELVIQCVEAGRKLRAFEFVFLSKIEDGSMFGFIATIPVRRRVRCSSTQFALVVAAAMLGEEVVPKHRLYAIVGVTPLEINSM